MDKDKNRLIWQFVESLFIALTANALKEFRGICLETGMDDYLSKPFERNQLAALLNRWVSSQSTESADKVVAAQIPMGRRSTLESKSLDYIRALRRPGEPDPLSKVIGLLLQILQDSVDNQDAAGLQQAAYNFKASSANLGAIQLAALCQELEKQGQTMQFDNAAALVTAVEQHYEAVREALAMELKEIA